VREREKQSVRRDVFLAHLSMFGFMTMRVSLEKSGTRESAYRSFARATATLSRYIILTVVESSRKEILRIREWQPPTHAFCRFSIFPAYRQSPSCPARNTKNIDFLLCSVKEKERKKEKEIF